MDKQKNLRKELINITEIIENTLNSLKKHKNIYTDEEIKHIDFLHFESVIGWCAINLNDFYKTSQKLERIFFSKKN